MALRPLSPGRQEIEQYAGISTPPSASRYLVVSWEARQINTRPMVSSASRSRGRSSTSLLIHGAFDAAPAVARSCGFMAAARETCMNARNQGSRWRQLRRLPHIEEYVPGSLAVVFGKVRRFRLEFVQYPLNRAPQCALLGSLITGFDGDGYLSTCACDMPSQSNVKVYTFRTDPALRFGSCSSTARRRAVSENRSFGVTAL